MKSSTALTVDWGGDARFRRFSPLAAQPCTGPVRGLIFKVWRPFWVHFQPFWGSVFHTSVNTRYRVWSRAPILLGNCWFSHSLVSRSACFCYAGSLLWLLKQLSQTAACQGRTRLREVRSLCHPSLRDLRSQKILGIWAGSERSEPVSVTLAGSVQTDA